MEDTTTIVELVIEPTALNSIVDEWAEKMKFSVHEKTGIRTIYASDIRRTRGWLSVEQNGKIAKLEAWLSPKGTGPDFTGSYWKGYKLALSKNAAIGPVAIYRKQFDQLMRSLESKSEKRADGTAAPLRDNRRTGPSKSTYVSTLSGLGIIAIVSSLISIYNEVSVSGSFYPDIVKAIPADALAGMVLGIVVLVSSFFLAKGKLMAIWLYSIAVLAVGSFALIRGNNFGYWTIGFGTLLIWQMFKYKTDWKLV